MSEYRIQPHPDQDGFPGRITVQRKINGKWKYHTHFYICEKVKFEDIHFTTDHKRDPAHEP